MRACGLFKLFLISFLPVLLPAQLSAAAAAASPAESGQLRKPFVELAEATPARKPFPAHWGEPPRIQTRDLRELPGGYGTGSGTLAKWIQDNLDKDAAAAPATPRPQLVQPRQPDGQGTISVSGELKQWHKITLTLDGPFAHERDNEPNPFTDFNMTVAFTHESGAPKYVIPGYFAADGNAANTSAESGTKWRVHLSPDKPGKWAYAVSFVKGKHVAVSDAKGEAWKPFDGQIGNFTITTTDKTGRDFRGKGRLQYVHKHHLQFSGSKEYFLKAGADAPETLLACAVWRAPRMIGSENNSSAR
jgi:hypothetical protein